MDYSTDWILRLVYKELWSEWNCQCTEISQSKGSFFHSINPNVPLKPWYRGFSLDPGEIKIINRLLTGHAYDKKYLNMIRVNDSSLCEAWDVVEDANHLIFYCSRYLNIRRKYAFFNRYTYLHDILRKYDKEDFYNLIKFIKECNMTNLL